MILVLTLMAIPALAGMMLMNLQDPMAALVSQLGCPVYAVVHYNLI